MNASPRVTGWTQTPPAARPPRPNKVVTALSITFAMVFLKSLLSYPAHMVFPSDFYNAVELAAGGPAYMIKAYVATVSGFLGLLLLYRLLPAKTCVEAFQRKPFVDYSPAHYVKVWGILAAMILLNCFILFQQAGYALPLLQGRFMDATEYSIYRSSIGEEVNMTLANLTLYLLGVMNVFVSFVCIRKDALPYRVGSLALLLLGGCFSLSRAFFPCAILILILTYVVYKPVALRGMHRLALPVALLTFVAYGMVTYSTKASWSAATRMMVDRQIHGQWLGMPLYLYYFEDHRAEASSFLHPLLRSRLGITVEATPGRELMEYFNPAGVAEGSAGNIPTFFAGEAYAVAGWWGIWLSVVYVSVVTWFMATVFRRMDKTYFSCCLYGWVAYKYGSGLTNGISAFLASGLMVVLLGLALWCVLPRKDTRCVARTVPGHDAFRRRAQPV